MKKELTVSWGVTLRLLREAHKRTDGKSWSQLDLAKALGVTVATVSRWETGDMAPSDTRKAEIARALGVSDPNKIFSLPRAS